MPTVGMAAVMLFDLAVAINGAPGHLSMSVVTALGQPPSALATVQTQEFLLDLVQSRAGLLVPEETQSFVEVRPRERSRVTRLFATTTTGPVLGFSLDLKTNELISIEFNPDSKIILQDALPEAPIRAR